MTNRTIASVLTNIRRRVLLSVRDRAIAGQTETVKPRVSHKPGRNQPCPCGSGKKSKVCCR